MSEDVITIEDIREVRTRHAALLADVMAAPEEDRRAASQALSNAYLEWAMRRFASNAASLTKHKVLDFADGGWGSFRVADALDALLGQPRALIPILLMRNLIGIDRIWFVGSRSPAWAEFVDAYRHAIPGVGP